MDSFIYNYITENLIEGIGSEGTTKIMTEFNNLLETIQHETLSKNHSSIFDDYLIRDNVDDIKNVIHKIHEYCYIDLLKHVIRHDYINCFKFLFINQTIPFTEEIYYKVICIAAKCNNYEIIKILIEKLTKFDEGYIKNICNKCIQKGLFETIDILMNHSERFKDSIIEFITTDDIKIHCYPLILMMYCKKYEALITEDIIATIQKYNLNELLAYIISKYNFSYCEKLLQYLIEKDDVNAVKEFILSRCNPFVKYDPKINVFIQEIVIDSNISFNMFKEIYDLCIKHVKGFNINYYSSYTGDNIGISLVNRNCNDKKFYDYILSKNFNPLYNNIYDKHSTILEAFLNENDVAFKRCIKHLVNNCNYNAENLCKILETIIEKFYKYLDEEDNMSQKQKKMILDVCFKYNVNIL